VSALCCLTIFSIPGATFGGDPAYEGLQGLLRQGLATTDGPGRQPDERSGPGDSLTSARARETA
jgi:hypothetical protein